MNRVLEARSISMDPTQWWRDEVEFNDEPELPMAITLTIAVVIISATFLAAYSAMGFGEAVFRELNDHYEMAEAIVLVGVLMLLLGYLLDVFTSDRQRHFKLLLMSTAAVAFGVSTVLAVDVYPSAPAALFVALNAGTIALLRMRVFNGAPTARFLHQLARALLLVGVATFVAWTTWILSNGYQWDDATKQHFRMQMECKEVSESCLPAFLVWAWPGMLAGVTVGAGAITYFLAASLERDCDNGDVTGTLSMHPAMRPLLIVLGLVAMGTYVSASITGIQMEMADVVIQFIMLSAAVLMLLFVTAFGQEKLGEEMKHMRLIQMMADYVDADWLKGLLLVTTLPLMLLLLLLSATNQAVRRSAMLPCTLALEPGDDMDALWWLTPKARAVSRWILKRPSPTLCWTMWMGVLYFCLDVGVGKITVIALSWLNVRCATLAPGMVAVIVCAFGIFLFLLPPIPGVPVYLFAGVVLVASLDDSMGFWPAVFITSILCLCIKLTACAIQQKVFGENLSDRVAVRRLVGMNSMTLRAIRYNLSQKGLTPAKVAILCGGPDWPTSVLCGILRLPLYECLLGTLPVYPIYLLFTVIAGAFNLKTGETWASAASTMLAVCSLTMTSTTLAAMYYIEDTVAKKRKELEEYPTDEQVAQLEASEAEGKEAYSVVTQWAVLPGWIRSVLLTGALLMSGATGLFLMGGSYCFKPFSVTSSIADDLNGNPTNLVKSMGWLALGMYFAACVLLTVYTMWGNSRAKEHLGNQSNADLRGRSVMQASAPVPVVKVSERVRGGQGRSANDSTRIERFY